VAVGSTSTVILGVPVDAIASPALQDRLREMLAGNRAQHIVTYNPEYAMAARRDPAFRRALQGADLVTADGVGIVVAARTHRATPPLTRLTGVELLQHLAAVSASTGSGLFLLGAGPGVAERTAAALRLAEPGVHISGWWSESSPDPRHDAETIARIHESGAAMLAVAYGAPGQIHWIARNLDALGSASVRIVVGVGGAFDYWAGEAIRPPAVIQKLGLEWLFRLIREPWRWRRQLVLPGFALLATIEGARSWIRRN
jgi:N-acetylglucosaminyldiphosphoundecaprenol N-acetyl-beta-D-mannosaminyltransferase